MSEDDLHMVAEEDDEPFSVVFHRSDDDPEPATATPPSPSPSPSPIPSPPTPIPASLPPTTSPPSPHPSKPSALNGHLLHPATAISPSPTPAVSVIALPSPLPTIKPVNINGGFPSSLLEHALPQAASQPRNPTPTPTSFHAPPIALKSSATPLTTSSASPSPSPYLFPPSPLSHPRLSAYAVSLLSSGSIFRSYKLNPHNNQVEFQDIKLYAIFPPSLTPPSSSSSSSTISPPPTPSRLTSPPTPSHLPPPPTEPTLYWGPPSIRTSFPSPHHMPLVSITDIFKGKKSLLFHSTSPLVTLLSNSRCFTISSPTLSLHLEAVTEQIREEWIVRIVEVIRTVGGKHLQFSRTDEGEEEESRREKERRERLRHIQDLQAAQVQAKPAATTSSASTASTDKDEPSTSSRTSGTLTPSASESTLSLSANSFLWRNMSVVTKERTAREKLEIQFDMRYTLKEMVHSAAKWLTEHSHHDDRVDSAEFTAVEKHTTTHLPTPSHPSANFQYKAYAGTIFTRLRWHFDVSDASYLSSVAGESGYADFIANSKSGSFFFYTDDKAYMIKSMTKDESEFLRVHVLPSYYHHLTVYRDSLLIKIFGLYRIRKKSMSHPVYFMVMKNVFFTQKPIHLRFDLKGSTLGRKATEREKEQETPVLKDIDFIEGTALNGVELPPTYLKIGMKKRAVLSQLAVDVKYLEQLQIMVTPRRHCTARAAPRASAHRPHSLLTRALSCCACTCCVLCCCRTTRCWWVCTTRTASAKPKRRRPNETRRTSTARGRADG